MEKNRISITQLVFLLFLSRIFTTLTYYPGIGSTVSGSALLYGNLIGVGVLFLLFLPLFYMAKQYPERSIVMNLRAAFRGGGSILAILYFIYLVLLAANTLAHFQFFMVNAVYPDASIWTIVIPMMLVCVYAAHIGIEGISRSSFIIFIGFVAAFLFIIFSSIQNVELDNLKPVEGNFFSEVSKGAFGTLSRSSELLLCYMLLPYFNQKGLRRGTVGLLTMMLVTFELMAFFIMTVLGDFSYSQTFPLFSLASMSGISIFQRMDALYMGIWVFVAFIKLSLLIFVSADILKFITPQAKDGEPNHRFSLVITSIFVFGLTIPACINIKVLSASYELLYNGITLLVLALLLPIIVLIKLKWMQHSQRGKNSE